MQPSPETHPKKWMFLEWNELVSRLLLIKYMFFTNEILILKFFRKLVVCSSCFSQNLFWFLENYLFFSAFHKLILLFLIFGKLFICFFLLFENGLFDSLRCRYLPLDWISFSSEENLQLSIKSDCFKNTAMKSV